MHQTMLCILHRVAADGVLGPGRDLKQLSISAFSRECPLRMNALLSLPIQAGYLEAIHSFKKRKFKKYLCLSTYLNYLLRRYSVRRISELQLQGYFSVAPQTRIPYIAELHEAK